MNQNWTDVNKFKRRHWLCSYTLIGNPCAYLWPLGLWIEYPLRYNFEATGFWNQSSPAAQESSLVLDNF